MTRLLHTLRVLVTVVVLGALIAFPVALAHFVGGPLRVAQSMVPLNWRHPDGTDVRNVVVAVLTLLCWVNWLRLVGAVTLQVACAARAMRVPQLRLLGSAQLFAAFVLSGGAVLGAQRAPAAVAGGSQSAVAVGPAGIELAWADAALVAVGAASAVALTQRGRRRTAKALPPKESTAPAATSVGTPGSASPAAREPVDRESLVWGLAQATGAFPLVLLRSPDGGLAVGFANDAPPGPSGIERARIGDVSLWRIPAAWPNCSGGIGVPVDPRVDQAAFARPPLVLIGRLGPDVVVLHLALARALEVRGSDPTAERVRASLHSAVSSAGALSSGEGDFPPPPGSARWALVEEAQSWVLHPLGWVVVPIGVERHEVDEVRARLGGAEVTEPGDPACGSVGGAPPSSAPPSLEVAPPAVAEDAEPPESDAPAARAALPPLPEWTFMVRVLGPVDVLDRAGTTVSFERAKSIEFLAWVVLHRRCATREAARTALWETDVRDGSFANVVSEARRALSRHQTPENHREWLGRPHGELIPLHPGVVSDVDVFRAFLARAESLRKRAADRGQVAEEMRCALALVRGAPFIGSGYAWADAEASTSACTLLIVNAALELGELELALGRLDDAFAVSALGLTVLPGHEELVALRLRAHAHSGDVVGIRHEWGAYLRSLSHDPWQSEPSPWLEELVRRLIAEPVGAA